jgi:hypothetical protein
MIIHYIKMYDVCTCFQYMCNLFSQTGEICRQNGRGYFVIGHVVVLTQEFKEMCEKMERALYPNRTKLAASDCRKSAMTTAPGKLAQARCLA